MSHQGTPKTWGLGTPDSLPIIFVSVTLKHLAQFLHNPLTQIHCTIDIQNNVGDFVNLKN